MKLFRVFVGGLFAVAGIVIPNVPRAAEPAYWLGFYAGDQAIPCGTQPSADAARLCACQYWGGSEAFLCPGKWALSPLGNYRDDVNGTYFCSTESDNGPPCTFWGLPVRADGFCSSGYEGREISGINAGEEERFTCASTSNPPPPENENRGQPDPRNLCLAGNPVNPRTGNKVQAETDYISPVLEMLSFRCAANHQMRELARQLGRSNKEVRRAIEQCKQENSPRGGPTRNPDVRVDPRTGEVYPETPGGGVGDSIGSIFEYLK